MTKLNDDNLTANEIGQMSTEQIWKRVTIAFRGVRQWNRKVKHYEDVLTRVTNAVEKNGFNNKRISALERLKDEETTLSFYTASLQHRGVNTVQLAVELAKIS